MTLLPDATPYATEVTVTDLEQTSPGQLRPAGTPRVEAVLQRAETPAPELSRFFYRVVGGDWYWVDRIGWTREQWLRWVDRPEHQLWSCWVAGAPAGYVELDRAGGDTEIAYFGLLPAYVGLGLGGWLLTEAARRAWRAAGTTRVWLHTCTLDSPAALANYRARGFEPCGTHTEWRDVREPTPGPWRGSR